MFSSTQIPHTPSKMSHRLALACALSMVNQVTLKPCKGPLETKRSCLQTLLKAPLCIFHLSLKKKKWQPLIHVLGSRAPSIFVNGHANFF